MPSTEISPACSFAEDGLRMSLGWDEEKGHDRKKKSLQYGTVPLPSSLEFWPRNEGEGGGGGGGEEKEKAEGNDDYGDDDDGGDEENKPRQR